MGSHDFEIISDEEVQVISEETPPEQEVDIFEEINPNQEKLKFDKNLLTLPLHWYTTSLCSCFVFTRMPLC